MPPEVVTDTFPIAALTGITATIWLWVALVTWAIAPPNFTWLADAGSAKLCPTIVAASPGPAPAGVKPVTVGAGTANVSALVVESTPTTTVAGALAKPGGTVTVSDVVVDALTVAAAAANLTIVPPAAKCSPWIVTSVPAGPLVGVIDATDGGSANSCELSAVPPAVVTVIVPGSAPAGTSAVRRVCAPPVTAATVPLNLMVFSSVGSEKFVP